MKTKNLSVRRLFLWICIGALLSMAIITLVLFTINFEIAVLATGGVLIFAQSCGLLYLHGFLQKGYLYLLLSYVRCLTI